MKSGSVFVIGAVDPVSAEAGGQVVRTANVLKLLRLNVADSVSITTLDTQQLKANPLLLLTLVFRICKSHNIIFMPSVNGLRALLAPVAVLCMILNKNLVYIAIGGWLDTYLKDNVNQVWFLRRANAVLVQNGNVRDNLVNSHNINNVQIFHNFRILEKTKESVSRDLRGFNLVFIGRVSEEKGVDMLFRLADYLNTIMSPEAFTIDIYGPIEQDFEESFNINLAKIVSVKYKGILKQEEVVSVLQNYKALLLPTRHPEGFPGSVLEAYLAGIPVIVSNWRHASEAVEHDVSGLIFEMNNQSMFNEHVRRLYDDEELFCRLSEGAKGRAKLYSSEKAWAILSKELSIIPECVFTD
jgi:glycosyltransferase involved in cell wall biosynthesis